MVLLYTIYHFCIPASYVDINNTKEKKKHRHKAIGKDTHGKIGTRGSVYMTKQEDSDSEGDRIIVDEDKVFHEQGDKVHIKLALALSIAALHQKWMPCISERFNYTHIISFNS